jgi:hypothetical protein
MPKWKLQSMQLKQAMRAGEARPEDEDARAQPGHGGGGSNFNPSTQMSAETYDDRTQCKWCNRKFNEEAAKRHIPICEGKYKAN